MMNKLILLLITFIGVKLAAIGQSNDELCKRWLLDGYIYNGVNMPPNEYEKHDFIDLKTDNTFTSIDDGKFDRGTWKLDLIAKTIYLFGNLSKEPMSLKLIN